MLRIIKGMEHVLYERPREKLRSHGVAYLSTVELVQLIIGSGTAQSSAARLAKKVMKRIEGGNFSFESLTEIDGLGEAKACQLLAVVELGGRLSQAIRNSSPQAKPTIEKYINEVKLSRNTALCIWFDGSNQEIDRKTYSYNVQQEIFVRGIFADALAVSARSILVFLYKKGQNIAPSAHDITLLGLIKESSRILQVAVIEVVAMNDKALKRWGQDT